MSEKSFVAGLVRKMRGQGYFVQRVEDVMSRGIPDIFAIVKRQPMWIEAKWLQGWPKRVTTPVHVGLRPEQVVWLGDCWRAGCPCYVVLRIARQTLWFKGCDASEIHQGLPRWELETLASKPPI